IDYYYETLGQHWLDKVEPEHFERLYAAIIASGRKPATAQHGCDDPHACGAKYHKTKECKEDCKRHKRRPRPPPCPPDCVENARMCPKRVGGGLVDAEVKSRAGKRTIVLPDELYALLEQHREAQAAEREHAGTVWKRAGGCSPSRTGGRSARNRTPPSGSSFS